MPALTTADVEELLLAEVEKRNMTLFRKVESFVVWVSENTLCEARGIV